MMRGLQRFYRVQYPYSSPLERHRASVVLLINLTLSCAIVLYLALVLVPRALQGVATSPLTFTLAPAAVVIGVFVHRAIQRGQLTRAANLFVTSLVLNGTVLAIFANTDQPMISQLKAMALIIPVIVAGLLLKRGGVVLVLVLLIAAALAGGWGQSQLLTPERIIPAQLVGRDLPLLLVILVLGATIVIIFTSDVQRVAEESVRHIQQRRWVVEYGLDLNQTGLAESVILARALTMLHDRMGYDFAQLYLYDADQNQLRRSMSTGLGQQDFADRGGFGLSETNAISESARLKQPLLVAAGVPGSGYLRPTSTYGAAVPILQGGMLLGVVDVQTNQHAPFSPTDMDTLALFAAEIGAGIASTRLIGDMQRQLNEQQTLVDRLLAQVSDYRQREQQSTSGAWGAYLEGRGRSIIGFDLGGDSELTLARDLPDELRRTLEQGSVHIETRGQEKVVHVPIVFRQQTLGAMTFHLRASQEVTSRQLEMAQVVSERLGLALENMRLFEQSQAQALRERKAGQITSQLIGAKDVDALLRLAAERFNEVLGAVHTRIYLQPDLLAESPAMPGHEETVR